MHMVVRAVVYAKDGLEALAKARDIFSEMCGDYRPFDYFVTFDEEGHWIAGKDRWGKLTPVARADSTEGKKLIVEGWDAQVQDFRQNLKKVRKKIFFSSWKKLLSNRMWRFACSCLYDTVGPDIYLYDNDGAPIGDEEHLQNALNKWECLYEDDPESNPYVGLKIFVVPADIHH